MHVYVMLLEGHGGKELEEKAQVELNLNIVLFRHKLVTNVWVQHGIRVMTSES